MKVYFQMAEMEGIYRAIARDEQKESREAAVLRISTAIQLYLSNGSCSFSKPPS